MEGEGRPRSGIAGSLTWREAIAMIGAYTDPEWDGTERRAPTGGEEKAETEKLLRLDAASLAGDDDGDRGEKIREEYLAKLEAAYAPGRAARLRWLDAYDRLRASVVSGALSAKARLPATVPTEDILALSPDDFRDHCPSADEDRIRLPRFANIPATVIIRTADLDRMFPPPATAPPKARKRGQYLPALRLFIERRPKSLAMSDQALAQAFQEHCREMAAPPPLPGKRRDIEKQIAAIRAKAAQGSERPVAGGTAKRR